jgi:isopenicillin-N epimerase
MHARREPGSRARRASDRPVDPPTGGVPSATDPDAPRSLTRRTLLGGALSLPAVAWLAGCGANNGAPEQDLADTGVPVLTAAGRSGGSRSWRRVRGLFELEPDVRHLSVFLLAPHSQPVRRAIDRYRRGFDRNPRPYLEANEAKAEQRVAAAAASHLGTSSDLVALTDSTTMGLALLIGGMRLTPGDEVLVTAHDHYAARESARYAADRAGATVRTIELYPPQAPEQASVRGILTAVQQGIGPATRLVVMTWVHSASGIRLPVRDIADIVARANASRAPADRALLIVDGAHGLGTGPASVADLGCDALVAGCHKWLLGPRGTGIAWARPEAWARLRPMIPSFDDRLFGPWIDGKIGTAPGGATFTPGGYHSFEHRWALNEAFDLHARIGARRIARRISTLSAQLRDGLSNAPKIRLHVPRESRLHSGVVCFSVDGVDPYDAIDRLYARNRVSASVTPYAVPLVRLGTCWVNTEAEVEAGIRAVRRL